MIWTGGLDIGFKPRGSTADGYSNNNWACFILKAFVKVSLQGFYSKRLLHIEECTIENDLDWRTGVDISFNTRILQTMATPRNYIVIIRSCDELTLLV